MNFYSPLNVRQRMHNDFYVVLSLVRSGIVLCQKLKRRLIFHKKSVLAAAQPLVGAKNGQKIGKVSFIVLNDAEGIKSLTHIWRRNNYFSGVIKRFKVKLARQMNQKHRYFQPIEVQRIQDKQGVKMRPNAKFNAKKELSKLRLPSISEDLKVKMTHARPNAR